MPARPFLKQVARGAGDGAGAAGAKGGGLGGGHTGVRGVFRVSGFGFRVSGFGFRCSGFGIRDSGFRFRVSAGGTCASSSAKMRVTICTSSSDAFSTTCHAPRGHPNAPFPRCASSVAPLEGALPVPRSRRTRPLAWRCQPCQRCRSQHHALGGGKMWLKTLPARCCEFPST